MADPFTAAGYSLSRRATLAGSQPITDLMARALENPDLISLAAGFVDNATLPLETVAAVLDEMMSDGERARRALQYGTTRGLPELRTALWEQIHEESDTPGSIDQLVITAGSNQLLHLIAESLLDPGDIVLCAAPTYLVFLGTLANVEARSWSVATDEHGLIPAALEAALEQLERQDELPRVKAIYLVPYFDNPCSITMPIARVAEIVEIARRWSRHHRIHVIADEAYRQLRYHGQDVPSAKTVDPEDDTVIVAGTFSKSFSPGIRVGWGVLPEHLVQPVLEQKGNIDFGSPNLNQHLMAAVLQQGLFESHVARLRESYGQKLQALLDAADEYLSPLEGVRWQQPAGGLYVWVELPNHLETGPEGSLFERAIEHGMLYVPGQYCYAAEGVPVHYSSMRLSFGVQSSERIRAGIEALSLAIEEIQQGG